MAIFCGRLLRGEPVTVFGDGRQTRDYVFVGDAVAALLAADAHLQTAGVTSQSPMNIGTGLETSVIELIDALSASLGATAEQSSGRRPGPARCSGLQSIPRVRRAELGWSAGHPDGRRPRERRSNRFLRNDRPEQAVSVAGLQLDVGKLRGDHVPSARRCRAGGRR